MEQIPLFTFEEEKKAMEKEQKVYEETLLLIDGSNMLSRGYYATAINPDNLTQAPNGRYTNGINVFLQGMLRYINFYNASHIAVCFDEGSFRKRLFPGYKQGRSETPAPLKEQFKTTYDLLEKIGVKVFKDTEYEADDYIAALAKQWKEKSDGNVYVISNDKDLLQLVDDQIIQVVRKKSDDVHYDRTKFKEEYFGLEPKQIIDLKSIGGDKSDAIIGISGIGEKGAKKILECYNSVEELYENSSNLDSSLKRYSKKIIEGKESAFLSKKLATLCTTIPSLNQHSILEDLEKKIDVVTLKEQCEILGLKRLYTAIEQGKY